MTVYNILSKEDHILMCFRRILNGYYGKNPSAAIILQDLFLHSEVKRSAVDVIKTHILECKHGSNLDIQDFLNVLEGRTINNVEKS